MTHTISFKYAKQKRDQNNFDQISKIKQNQNYLELKKKFFCKIKIEMQFF